VQVESSTGVAMVAGGLNHAMAWKSDSAVWAVVGNWFAPLGDETALQRLTPVQVSGWGRSGLAEVSAPAAGFSASLASKTAETCALQVQRIEVDRSVETACPASTIFPCREFELSPITASSN
jgi:hypothetical protein